MDGERLRLMDARIISKSTLLFSNTPWLVDDDNY